jgi:tetratricopeptide (TPR) repeat protein
VLPTPFRNAAALLLALGAALTAPAADPPAKPPTKEQIAEWVKGLGSDSFEEREKASKALWKAGQAAEAALRQVLKDGDPEAGRRAREILDKFDWGLYPDTPEAVASLIEEYRSRTGESRAALVPKLFDHGSAGFTALTKIAAAERSPETRALISSYLTSDMPRLAAALLAEGQDARLEELLELALGFGGDVPYANYAAYLLERGKLDEKVRALEKKAGAAPDKKAALTLAYLCRAKGDLAAARKYAEKAEQAAFLQTVLVEQEDWKALLKLPPGGPPAPADTERVGWRLACLRLAGDREGFEAELGKHANDYLPASAYLLNGRPDGAQKALTRSGLPSGELLAARLRFREALDAADKPVAPGRAAAWSEQLFKAKLLARLGERKQAGALFDKLPALAQRQTKSADAVAEVLVAQYNAGFKDEALARTAKLLAKVGEGQDTFILNYLFPPADYGTSMGPWWTFLRRKYPEDDAAATLKRLHDLLGGKLPPRDAAALLKAMADAATNPKAEEREPWLRCAAETCRLLGRDDLWEGCLEKWAAAGGGKPALLGLGDVAAGGKRWKEAAERYKKCWETNRGDALPLYLHGRALVQAGQEKEGRRWMEIAELMPLDIMAFDFALELAERGLDQPAGRMWQRLGRVGEFWSAIDGDIARALAEKAVADKDYLKAATHFRREALHELWEPGGQHEVEAQLWLAAAEHRYRARGLAAAGRFDEMHREVQAGLDMDPGNIGLCIDVTTELMKRGRKKEADELFARVYAVWDGVCKEFPQSAWAHNKAARLAVRCKRDLDAALDHARKGVELDPDDAGHLDTLAEVYFQRGDRDKAVELMKRCVEMQPRYDYFRKQLRRMQAGDRDADVPPSRGGGGGGRPRRRAPPR